MLNFDNAINSLADAQVGNQIVKMSMTSLTETLGSESFKRTTDAIASGLSTLLESFASKNTDQIDLGKLMATQVGMGIFQLILDRVMLPAGQKKPGA